MLGKAAFTSRNRSKTNLSCDAHASLMNLVRSWSESVVECPGLPPEWVELRAVLAVVTVGLLLSLRESSHH